MLASINCPLEPGASAWDIRIGERLSALRSERAITVEKLAAAAGLEPAHIERFEVGKARISAITLSLLARALDVPMMMLLDGI